MSVGIAVSGHPQARVNFVALTIVQSLVLWLQVRMRLEVVEKGSISPDWRFRWSSPRFGGRVRSSAATSRRLQGFLYLLIQRCDEIVLDRELLTHL